jgi:hypothetical protein
LKDIQEKTTSGYYNKQNSFNKHFLRVFIPLMILLAIPVGLVEFMVNNTTALYVAMPGTLIAIAIAVATAQKKANDDFKGE